MRKTSLSIAAVAVLLFGAACSRELTVNVNTSAETTNSNELELENDSESNANRAATNINVNRSNDDANTNESDDDRNTNDSSEDRGPAVQGTLRVDTPKTGQQVVSPFEIEGKSNTDKVYVRVKSTTGTEIFTTPVTVRGGEFHVNITLSLGTSKTVTLDVFQKDAGGDEANLISLPLNVKVTAAESSNTNTSDTNDNDNDNENENEND